jgi:hypothetical protein
MINENITHYIVLQGISKMLCTFRTNTIAAKIDSSECLCQIIITNVW